MNLHELPQISDRLSFLYLEHVKIEQENNGIVAYDKNGKTSIPIANTAVLMIGPGSCITHSAIVKLAEYNCLAIWCGEQNVRFYSYGLGGSRNSKNLLQQASSVCNYEKRLKIAYKMYQKRFNKDVSNLSIQQLRGKEGIRVRNIYKEKAKEFGIEWNGRSYNSKNWNSADISNRCLSAGNTCLYGICHAVILSLGYSPALGFIHTGNQKSFVFDIADLYKTDIVIPIAFRVASKEINNVEKKVRLACRDVFYEKQILNKITEDIEDLFDFSKDDNIKNQYKPQWWEE